MSFTVTYGWPFLFLPVVATATGSVRCDAAYMEVSE